MTTAERRPGKRAANYAIGCDTENAIVPDRALDAGAVAAAVVTAGWPVVPVTVESDEKRSTVRWTRDAITRTGEMDTTWPRWAAICGVPRQSDGRALVCVDADSQHAVDVARSLWPGHCQVRTGRAGGGLHVWLTVPADAPPEVRSRYYVSPGLDWRGGGAYALLPGSQYAPISRPQRLYRHDAGPPVHLAGDCPAGVLRAVANRCPAASRTMRSQGEQDTTAERRRAVRLDGDGAFARFIDAAGRSGRQVRMSGPGRAMVSCPTARHPHGNRRPALYVTARPGGIGLHCFARECPHDEVLAALGLGRADLFDPLDMHIEVEA